MFVRLDLIKFWTYPGGVFGCYWADFSRNKNNVVRVSSPSLRPHLTEFGPRNLNIPTTSKKKYWRRWLGCQKFYLPNICPKTPKPLLLIGWCKNINKQITLFAEIAQHNSMATIYYTIVIEMQLISSFKVYVSYNIHRIKDPDFVL
ncbi:hypothetical protein NQ317_014535 [Molorchus minor]|uniref:Uncharacterized protein n=1 Tax=Molorchus minor TaxID=1323400 RepID=A0ABQ9IXV0_9CUCU|nr:hypothetical protein NQ317_014535 [Molorchus minor]